MKRLLSVVLCLMLVFSAMPLFAITASAAKGEALTSWTPSKFLVEDWENSEGMFTADGQFTVPTGLETRTVWTNKSYDLSTGFVFKGSLTMKNGYNNFYGEWCSAYFGTKDKSLELRVRNDQTEGAPKDNTYTAYLIYNGTIIATSDLSTDPNAMYTLTYNDGVVTVCFNETLLKWSDDSGEAATAVDIKDTESILSNAKLGLRLSNNNCPNGRRWKDIVLAPEDHETDYKNALTFYVYKGEASVIGGSHLVGEVIIPSTYEGYPVTEIGKNAFKDCGDITSVIIPDGVKSIGNSAFDHCDSLAKVTIPDSVTYIGQYAFCQCDALTTITLPKGLTTIDMWAFSFCDSLSSVVMPDSVSTIGVAAFYECKALKNVYYRGSEEDRSAISVGNENSCLTDAAWTYNYVEDNGKNEDKDSVKDSVKDSDATFIIVISVVAVLLVGVVAVIIIKKKKER